MKLFGRGMKVQVLRLGANNEAWYETARTGSEILMGDEKANLIAPGDPFNLRMEARKEFGIALLGLILAVLVGYAVNTFGADILITVAAGMIFGTMSVFSLLLGIMRRKFYKPLAIAMEGEPRLLSYMDRFPEWSAELDRLVEEAKDEEMSMDALRDAIADSPVLNRGFRRSPRSDEELYGAVSDKQAVRTLRMRKTPWEIIVIIVLAMAFLLMAVMLYQMNTTIQELTDTAEIAGRAIAWR